PYHWTTWRRTMVLKKYSHLLPLRLDIEHWRLQISIRGKAVGNVCIHVRPPLSPTH
ncbi:hypothetical protein L9F63_026177, partial [Diploptera punctata]